MFDNYWMVGRFKCYTCDRDFWGSADLMSLAGNLGRSARYSWVGGWLGNPG